MEYPCWKELICNAKAYDHKSIYVATDDNRIVKFCKEKKINVIKTSKRCLTGTDRVAEVAKRLKLIPT